MKKTSRWIFGILMSAMMLSGCGAPAAPSSTETAASSSSQMSSVSETAGSSTAEGSSVAESNAAVQGDLVLPETLIVGLDASFPPMGFTDENNNVVGFDIDLAQAVCDKLGIKMEAKPIDWAAKEMELETDKITCIWNGMTITDERKEAFALSRPYMSNEQVVVVMEDSDIQAIADLEGKVVAAQADSSGLYALQDNAIYASIAEGAAKEYADYVTALSDLEVGRCEAIVMDSVVANYYIAENQKPMRVLEETMAAEEYGIGFKKGNEALLAAVEQALYELDQEGKIAEISTKWFGRADVVTTYAPEA